MTTLRFPRGLYGITPEWDDTKRLIQAVHQAANGGMRALQLRRKHASVAVRRTQALELAQVCRHLGIIFIINDHWELALEVGADGVHLGREDGDLTTIRAQAPGLCFGTSCYDDLEHARLMIEAGTDYLAFGTIYPSCVKPSAVRAPLACLTQARRWVETLPLPRPSIVAIGGITATNVADVAKAGADAVAVITGVFEAPDIQTAAAGCAHPFLTGL